MEDDEKQENRQVGPRGPQDDGRLQEAGESQDQGGSVGTQDHGGLPKPGELQKPRGVSRIKGTNKPWRTTTTTTTTTSLFLTLNIQISHHLQIARLIEAGGV